MLDKSVYLNKGFTMVELVTVIAIASILAATAMPRFASNETFNTRGDTGLIASSLRYAQKVAVAKHANVFVVTDTVTKNLKLCLNATCTTSILDPNTQTAYQLNLSSSVSLVASSPILGFNALGQLINNSGTVLNNNATFTVANIKNNAQSTTLNVEAETGYVY